MPPVRRSAGKPSHLCSVAFCRKRRAKGRGICSKHHTDWYRETHPVNYFFNMLRVRARRRRVKFLLTLAEFGRFCRDTNYLALKGRFKSDLSIDRIREELPYHVDNIQVLTVGENVSKRRAWEAVQRKIRGPAFDRANPARHIFSEATPPDAPW